MAAISLTTLRSRARERADMVNSAFISDTAVSLDAWINKGLQLIHEKLVEAYGDEYLESSSTFTTAASAETYLLPAGFLKLIDIELQLNGQWTSLKKYQRPEANAYRSANLRGDRLPRYRLSGANVRLLPVPANGIAGRIWYVPTHTVLVNGADTVDLPNGWEEYAVLYAAKVALGKEESDISAVERELGVLDTRLDQIKLDRDMGQPNQVVDVDADSYDPLFNPR